jgi:hypothetical protein
MLEFLAVFSAVMVIIYALDNVFHLGIFDKLEKLLEK